MLYLQFQLDQQRYLMDTTNVETLLPVVRIQAVPNAPKYVLGVINFRGESVPVVDMAQLVLGRESHCRLSTRIVLINFNLDGSGVRRLGLMIEKATEVIKLQEHDFKPASLARDSASYIVSTYADPAGIAHLISSNALLSSEQRKTLFGA